jgi:hypothetical protein
MVIWKKEGSWNGLGFLGESRHGKTPLSLAFAQLLFRGGVQEIRVFDDCFKLEREKVRQCREWGARGQLAETYYSELAKAMSASHHAISELAPGDHTYQLHDVAMCLLIVANSGNEVKMERCSREEFVDKLMPFNPFAWDYPKPGKNLVLQRFKETWRYFIMRGPSKTTKELVDAMANEAFEESKRLGS